MLFFSQILMQGVTMTDFYEIRVEGHLNPQWFVWFTDLELTYPVADETLLSGLLPDQAALHGLLERIRDRRAEARGVRREWVEQRIVDRAEARSNKDFAAADRIRVELTEAGVELLDSPAGTTWQIA